MISSKGIASVANSKAASPRDLTRTTRLVGFSFASQYLRQLG
jgi:hypothetical protein